MTFAWENLLRVVNLLTSLIHIYWSRVKVSYWKKCWDEITSTIWSHQTSSPLRSNLLFLVSGASFCWRGKCWNVRFHCWIYRFLLNPLVLLLLPLAVAKLWTTHCLTSCLLLVLIVHVFMTTWDLWVCEIPGERCDVKKEKMVPEGYSSIDVLSRISQFDEAQVEQHANLYVYHVILQWGKDDCLEAVML